MSRSRPGIPAFNEMDDDEARDRLLTCLDVPRWADDVLAGRPYDTWTRSSGGCAAAASTLTDDELERALARHPRIGERADAAAHDAEPLDPRAGRRGPGRRRRRPRGWPRATGPTRSGSTGSSSSARRAGTPPRSSSELRRRLDNSDEAERAETIDQLTQIALLRVREVLA